MPIRVVRGITAHFPSRAPEWFLAVMLVLYGVILLMPAPAFNNPAFATIRRFVDEDYWGGAAVVVGLLRLTALTVNGTLYNIEPLRLNKAIWARILVTYSRYSPHVRAVAALCTCFFWFSVTLGFFSSGTSIPPSTAIFGVLFFLDIYSASRASIDADRVNRNVPL